ncbi:MAG: TetR/AcrR family transcriptional regulator [Candidatus Merdivicinus sp.]
MPVDIKDSIAQAAKNLVIKKGVKKLTVKDIVEECHITRQAFYYHFEDIPALFRWILERNSEQTLQEAKAMKNGEEKLRYLFLLAINSLPYMKKGMETNYRYELEHILTQYTIHLFKQMCDEEGLYQNCSRLEVDLILRYHSQAIMGFLRNWTETDTKNLDQIVHVIYRLMTEGISPIE